MGTTKLLTVDELLKMSEDDYMDERQLAFFKNRLQTMEAELRANADQTTVNLRETTVVPIRPTAPRSKRSTRLNCVPVTARASF